MTSFITRVNGESKTYKIIIDTNEEGKYEAIQKFCRILIMHNKPSDEVFEAVRCKDCKHCVISHGRHCTYGDCSNCLVSDNFFCKNGERRTEDE